MKRYKIIYVLTLVSPVPVRTVTNEVTNDIDWRLLNPCRNAITRFMTIKNPKAMNAVVAMDRRLIESIISSSSFSSVITMRNTPRKKRRYITIDMNLVWVWGMISHTFAIRRPSTSERTEAIISP